MHYGSEAWPKEGHGFVTSDLKAVCEAANEFGIDEIIVNDEHDLGNREPNVFVKDLPGNVKMVNKPHLPGKPRRMTQEEPFTRKNSETSAQTKNITSIKRRNSHARPNTRSPQTQ